MERILLTDDELHMLIQALKHISFSDQPDQVRLQRKLNRWLEHPDLQFTTTEKRKILWKEQSMKFWMRSLPSYLERIGNGYQFKITVETDRTTPSHNDLVWRGWHGQDNPSGNDAGTSCLHSY